MECWYARRSERRRPTRRGSIRYAGGTEGRGHVTGLFGFPIVATGRTGERPGATARSGRIRLALTSAALAVFGFGIIPGLIGTAAPIGPLGGELCRTIEPRADQVFLYQDVGYRGACQRYRVGERFAFLGGPVGNDVASSVKVGAEATLHLYADAEYEGDRRILTTNVRDLRSINFNDVASSLRVRARRT